MKKILVLLFILGHFAFFVTEAMAQIPVQLPTYSTSKSVANSSAFYISSIVDERKDQDSNSTLLFSSNALTETRKKASQIASREAITEIFGDSIVRDTSLAPLSIRIKTCRIKESVSGSDRVGGEVTLELMFELEKENGSVLLTPYKSTARYSRPLTSMSIIEPTLRKVLGNSLKFINSWINTSSNRNPAFAKSIELTFSDYLEQDGDTVYYDPMRPLIWDDFREKRSENKFAATVFPSFGYDQRSKIEGGIIKVDLVMKVFVVKSASWVGPGNKGTYSLKHEQRHFDLVKIVSERFKKKLLTEKLTPDNYQGIINFEYIEFYREMNRIQKEYDEQTSHGTSQLNQESWNKRIDAELKLLGK